MKSLDETRHSSIPLIRKRELIKKLSHNVISLNRLRTHSRRQHVKVDRFRWPVMSYVIES